MKNRLFWLLRSLKCFIKGHDDVTTFYNPVSGERDLGFTCFRCGRPRLTNFAFLIVASRRRKGARNNLDPRTFKGA